MTEILQQRKTRIHSIDLLRGFIMVLMILDHVRDYFHAGTLQGAAPLDLSVSSSGVFLTRIVTHLAAPSFMFLAGTSIFLMGRKMTKAEQSRFLVTRGLWLIFVEVVIISTAWTFGFMQVGILQVIWAFGVCFVLMAALVHLPLAAQLVLGVAIVFGHNLLDGWQADPSTVSGWLAAIFHERAFFAGVIPGYPLVFAYPVLPWLGIMLCGVALGKLYDGHTTRRRLWLWLLGGTATLLFVVLRFANVYGNLEPMPQVENTLHQVLLFFDTTKYPPSLQFTLMTLGPAMLILAATDGVTVGKNNPLLVLGRVPLAFYLGHIFWIHGWQLVLGWAQGYDSLAWVPSSPDVGYPEAFGFGLPGTYLVTLVLLATYYPLVWAYYRYKQSHSHWWLSYL